MRQLVLAGDVAALQAILDAAKTVDEEVVVPDLAGQVARWRDS